MSALIKYNAARQALQLAASIDEVKDIRDKSLAMAAYAKQAKDTELIGYANEIRARAERKAGLLLRNMEMARGRLKQGAIMPVVPKKNHGESPQTLAELGISKKESAAWQKIAAMPNEVFEEVIIKPITTGNISISKAYQEIKSAEKKRKLVEKKVEVAQLTAKDIADNRPVLKNLSYGDLFRELDDKSFDLLITDPPYSTDLADIDGFIDDWLFAALAKIKDGGRAYICIGAYPVELAAYLNKLARQSRFIVDCPLIWTYRNTLGVTPKNKYNLNYQVILHLYQSNSNSLDNSITNEMFSVQDINAPDGRQGDRFHTWQKPEELALRLIRHSTKVGDSILDPFSCTGTFPIAASKLGRNAIGCDISLDNLKIAEARGCHVVLY